MLTDEEWAVIDAIEGWLFREEAELLARLSVSPWCEVGAWKGRSTRVLARGGHGWVVDWFKGSSEHPAGTDTREEFYDNTFDLDITVLEMDYACAVPLIPTPIKLLYLDAEHTYEATREVFALFAPLVDDDGLVIIHDAWADDGGGKEGGMTPWPGVTLFVRELIEDGSPFWENVENVARCAVFRRKP